jgi:hypothetical protein
MMQTGFAGRDSARARSVAPVSKSALPNRIQIWAKRAFSKLEHAILAGAGFETGATERALSSIRRAKQRVAALQGRLS